MRSPAHSFLRAVTLPVRFGLGGKSHVGRVARRIWLAVFLLVFVVTPLVWMYLAATFHLSQPADSFRLVDHFNAHLDDIPEHDRAWPLYKRALDELRLAGVVEDRMTRGWTTNRPATYVLLPAGFMTTEEGRQEQLLNLYQLHEADIAMLIEGTKRPKLGLSLPDEVEDYFDNSDYPDSGSSGALPHLVTELEAVGTLLQGEFLVAHLLGDADRMLEVAGAQVALMKQFADGLPLFSGYWHYRVRQVLADDLTQSLTDKPEVWSRRQLNELRALCGELRAVEPPDEKVTTLVARNFLDQMYSESGYLTSTGLEKIAIGCRQSSAVNIQLQETHRQWLSPNSGRTGWRRQFTAAMVLPIAVRGFSTRDELLAQLEAKWAERRKKMEVPAGKRPTNYLKTIEINVENWRDIPGIALARDSLSPIPLNPYPTRFAALALLCELVAIHNDDGEWPGSLESIDKNAVPRDPFTQGEPLQYELRYSRREYVPYIWSIGADKVSQNGDRLRAHPSGLDDWRIVPVKLLPPMVEKR